ncbi:MAG: HDOD domain-containing protein [Thermodesulfobacteriota bacterium]|nr:HDOD domain-containing protein [Thermodesulfobacteriota bacterium]
MSPANERKIYPILQHSLLTAFIAKKIGPIMKLNADEVFVCGILHDIGKTVLIGFLEGYKLSRVQNYTIMKQYHTDIGYLLAKAWKFSEVVQQAVQFHHNPSLAKKYSQQVFLVHWADRIAHEENTFEFLPEICDLLQAGEEQVKDILEHIAQLRDTAVSLV